MSDDTSVRPYRLLMFVNPKKGKGFYVQWAYYAVLENARWGAMRHLKHTPVGTVIQVININTTNLLGEYTRRVDGIGVTNDASWAPKE